MVEGLRHQRVYELCYRCTWRCDIWIANAVEAFEHISYNYLSREPGESKGSARLLGQCHAAHDQQHAYSQKSPNTPRLGIDRAEDSATTCNSPCG